MISCSKRSEKPSPVFSFSSRPSMNWGWGKGQKRAASATFELEDPGFCWPCICGSHPWPLQGTRLRDPGVWRRLRKPGNLPPPRTKSGPVRDQTPPLIGIRKWDSDTLDRPPSKLTPPSGTREPIPTLMDPGLQPASQEPQKSGSASPPRTDNPGVPAHLLSGKGREHSGHASFRVPQVHPPTPDPGCSILRDPGI